MPCGFLIFDLDGTLFQVDKVTIPAVQGALQEAGYLPPTEDEITYFFGRPESEWHAWLRARYPGITETTKRAIAEWELRIIPEAGALYPGVRAMLPKVRALVAQMAICSNGPQSYVECVVRSHGLAPYFDCLRWHRPEDDGKPQMVRDLLTHFHSRPALVIGDRGDDITAAHENGLLAIAIRYGFGTDTELMNADAYVSTPEELPVLLRSFLIPDP